MDRGADPPGPRHPAPAGDPAPGVGPGADGGGDPPRAGGRDLRRRLPAPARARGVGPGAGTTGRPEPALSGAPGGAGAVRGVARVGFGPPPLPAPAARPAGGGTPRAPGPAGEDE